MIEDEPLVRDVFTTILQHRGFKVFHAGPCCKPDTVSQCGLQCFGNGQKPDLVVIAVISPRDCTGVEAAHMALRRWSDVKILLTSASPKEVWPRSVADDFDTLPTDSCAFLAKPFTMSQLLAAVKCLLGRTA